MPTNIRLPKGQSAPSVADLGVGPMAVPGATASVLVALLGRVARTKNVQRFLRAAKKASVDLRQLVTSGQERPPTLFETAEYLATKFPRTVGHTKLAARSLKNPTLAETRRNISSREGSPPFTIRIDPRVARSGRAGRALSEEVAHVGQALASGGPEKFFPRYSAATRGLGYVGNPFEVGAKRTADRKINQLIEALRTRKRLVR